MKGVRNVEERLIGVLSVNKKLKNLLYVYAILQKSKLNNIDLYTENNKHINVKVEVKKMINYIRKNNYSFN